MDALARFIEDAREVRFGRAGVGCQNGGRRALASGADGIAVLLILRQSSLSRQRFHPPDYLAKRCPMAAVPLTSTRFHTQLITDDAYITSITTAL